MLLFSLVEYFIAVRQGRVFWQRYIFHMRSILLISYICTFKASATLLLPESLMQYWWDPLVYCLRAASTLCPLFQEGEMHVPSPRQLIHQCEDEKSLVHSETIAGIAQEIMGYQWYFLVPCVHLQKCWCLFKVEPQECFRVKAAPESMSEFLYYNDIWIFIFCHSKYSVLLQSNAGRKQNTLFFLLLPRVLGV